MDRAFQCSTTSRRYCADRSWICSEGLSYANSPPLKIAAGAVVTIDCPDHMIFNLYSTMGRFEIGEGAQVTFVNCDVKTKPNREAAADGPFPPNHLDDYFGLSHGAVIFFRNSRLLLPAEVCCQRTLACIWRSLSPAVLPFSVMRTSQLVNIGGTTMNSNMSACSVHTVASRS